MASSECLMATVSHVDAVRMKISFPSTWPPGEVLEAAPSRGGGAPDTDFEEKLEQRLNPAGENKATIRRQ